jgi:hypothetical protein
MGILLIYMPPVALSAGGQSFKRQVASSGSLQHLLKTCVKPEVINMAVCHRTLIHTIKVGEVGQASPTVVSVVNFTVKTICVEGTGASTE